MSYHTADELDRLAADLLALVPRIRAAAKALRHNSPAFARARVRVKIAGNGAGAPADATVKRPRRAKAAKKTKSAPTKKRLRKAVKKGVRKTSGRGR